jgi:hypothetical protein
MCTAACTEMAVTRAVTTKVVKRIIWGFGGRGVLKGFECWGGRMNWINCSNPWHFYTLLGLVCRQGGEADKISKNAVLPTW